MLNEALKFPISNTASKPDEPDIFEPRPPWWVRFGIATGLFMGAQPPKVWTLSPAVVTLCLVILTLVAGGAYYMGQKDAQYQQLKEASEKSAATSAEALKLATYAVKDADVKSGHAEPSKTPDSKQK